MKTIGTYKDNLDANILLSLVLDCNTVLKEKYRTNLASKNSILISNKIPISINVWPVLI